MLTYYHQNLGMEAVEINSTYYALIRQKTIENMVKRVSPRFKFAVKAYQGITHQFGKKSQAEIQKDIENFRFTIEPLAKGDRLIAVLLQSPRLDISAFMAATRIGLNRVRYQRDTITSIATRSWTILFASPKN